MCEPSTQEKQIEGQDQAYAQTVQNNYKTLFGEQQGVMSNLNDIFTPIAEAGPNQTGMSAAQLAAENTTAIDTTGENYANAARSLNGQLAGRSTSAGETGPTQAIKGQLASAASGQLSNEELGITQQDYALGRQNFAQATGGLEALNSSYGSTSAGNSGTQAGSTAFGEADEIAQQEAQEQQAIAGGVTSLALDAASGGAAAAAAPAGSSGFGAFLNGFSG